jgi:hypothetical protein
MGNIFFSPEPERDEPPRRLFASVDHRADNRFYLDAIDANQAIDFGFGGGLEYWHEWPDRARIYVLEIPVEYARFLNCITGNDEGDGWPRLWFDITLAPGGGVARLYRGLFADPEPTFIYSLRLARPAYAKKLSKMIDLTRYVATQWEIKAALELPEAVSWIGVYDVGQGSANGICDADSVPLAYFDLGGGVLGIRRSYYPIGIGIIGLLRLAFPSRSN